jgi:RNA polymerase sigma-70 factor, ECF subfamily
VQTQITAELDETLVAALPDRSLAEDDDMSLVAAVESGHPEAFEILVRRHRTKILRTVLRFTHNREDAEDIVQQSLQKAFFHLHQFEGNSSFSTWLTRIAINEALMLRRKRGSAIEIAIEQPSTENGVTLSLDLTDSSLSPEDSCVQEEQKELLSAALNQLNPNLRKAIELREINELSTEQAARKMGLTVAAVKARVFHGRRKLRKILKQLTSRNHRLRPWRERRVVSRNLARSESI